ncbi:hypothetical protein, partial [Hymenobacter coccineus]|uniref:hypothetical protein n=1 Tax=Hymenobacter coccineus TaxID=1908235 RepID=UPI0019554BFE
TGPGGLGAAGPGLPVALALPTLVECRFLLPLQPAAAHGGRRGGLGPAVASRARWRQAVAAVVLAAVLWGGWQLAAATAAQLQPGDVPAY